MMMNIFYYVPGDIFIIINLIIIIQITGDYAGQVNVMGIYI